MKRTLVMADSASVLAVCVVLAWPLAANARQEKVEEKGQAPAQVQPAKADSGKRDALAAQEALDKDDFLEKMNQAVRRIAAAVEPSVVHVSLEARIPGFRSFVQQGAGSGWVWSYENGMAYVITNHHVVDKARRITVQLFDGRRIRGEVVGSDPSTDIAVVKFASEEPLVPMRRASSAPVQQGDRVYAFGSPFGFKFSMSEGIVSGLSRELGMGSRDTLTNYIQSDASVNPGNSGGPLVDIRGRVVGMNVAIATEGEPDEVPDAAPAPRRQENGDESTPRQPRPRDGNGVRYTERVSFAIPLSTIEPIVGQLLANGVVAKGFLGVTFPLSDEINQEQLRRAKFRGTGVSIVSVLPGAPAYLGGLKPEDVITKVNGADVLNIPALRSMIAVIKPGETITVSVWRKGESIDLSLALADKDVANRKIKDVGDSFDNFGIMPANIGTIDGRDGIFIGQVRTGSAAYRSGLRNEDRILSVNGEPTRSVDTLISALSVAGFLEGKPVAVVAEDRDGDQRKLTLKREPPDESK